MGHGSHDQPTQPEILALLLRMGDIARSEGSQAKRSFADRDVGLPADLVRQDREVNQSQREIFRQAIQAGEDVDTREWAMHMTLVARCLERISENAAYV